jgi:hypothetical protein
VEILEAPVGPRDLVLEYRQTDPSVEFMAAHREMGR